MIEFIKKIDAINARVSKLETQEFPFFTSSLNVGIGGTPSYKLDVFGSFRAQNTILSGTLTVPTLTSGSIPFIGAGGLVLQDNSNLFWDDANNRLKVPAIVPATNNTLSISSIGGTGASAIELGDLGTGNRFAYIDFHGDDTNVDYGLRIIRSNTGANAPSTIYHIGTGELGLVAVDAGSIALYTSNLTRLSISSAGAVNINQSLTVQSGLNVGSATAAATGEIKTSSHATIAGGLNLGNGTGAAAGQIRSSDSIIITGTLPGSAIQIIEANAAGARLALFTGEPGVSYQTAVIGYNYVPLNGGASGRLNTSIGAGMIRFTQTNGTIDLLNFDASGNVNYTIRTDYNGGPRIGFLGLTTPVGRQTGGALTAAATYGANEQTMLQRAFSALRAYGLLT